MVMNTLSEKEEKGKRKESYEEYPTTAYRQ